MLVGLLRMRRETTDTSNLGRFFWKQVRWFQFSPAVILPHLPGFTNANIYLSGSLLDYDCHPHRSPYSGTSGPASRLSNFAHHVTGIHDFGSER